MNKKFLSFGDIERLTVDLAKSVEQSGWKPTIIVGVTRGGLLTAKMLSHWFSVPMCTLDVSLRDNSLWQADTEKSNHLVLEVFNQHNLLIVDDINDSGATNSKIKRDWTSTLEKLEPKQRIWPFNQIRFGVLIENQASTQKSDYWGMQINKREEPVWLVFPWERAKDEPE
jgi:hypoxanthine phosphoribosyltransferase